MPTVDDELTRRFQRAERPVDGDGVFEGLGVRRSRRERLRRIQAGLVAFTVLTATAGGFVALREAFEPDDRGPVVSSSPNVLLSNGEIVFERDDAADGATHLYRVRSDGTHVQQLTDSATGDGAPAVSPDGRTVAFVHALGDHTPVIATIPIDGGTVTRLTDKRLFVSGPPAWSPDGSRIAFAAHDGDGQRLFVMNADGSDVRPITDADGLWVTGGAWSPDGTRIGFTGSLFDDKGELTSSDIFTVRPDGSDLINITQTPAARDDEAGPSWSPDGMQIAFDETSGRGSVVIVRNLADGTERTITEGHVDDGPAWSPDGSLIAFNRSRLEGGGFDVWLVRPDGSGLRRLTDHGGFNPAWQPVRIASGPVPTSEPEPSSSPEPELSGQDVGLSFRLCDLHPLGGIDFLGNGTDGKAWTGAELLDDGTCPNNYDTRYGVAVDFTGDGVADSWSGDTIESCVGCEPFKAIDLNGDDRAELIVIQTSFSIMQYGVYTVIPVDGQPQVVPFRTGEPGHSKHSLVAGEPFTFWAGGDAGLADWFYCDMLPEFRLTGTESPIDGGPDAETTVHETHVSLGTDGIAHILDARTYSVVGQVDLQYATTKPDCGLGVDIWRLSAEA
jgi:Tol biopolymer transport system component